MTTTNLVLVLLAALIHASWNLAAKNARGDATVFVWLYFTGSALLCVPIGAVVLAADDGVYGWELLIGPLVTAVFHISYSMLLQTGYRHSDLTVVYPVARGVGPLLAVVVAVTVLGERPEPVALAGGALIIIGVAVVTGRNLARGSPRVRTGVVYGAATGAAIAAYTLWDDFAVSVLGIGPIIYFGLGALLQSALMIPWVVRKRHLIRATWDSDRREIAAVAVLSPLAYILVLYALQTTSVALVAPVRESSIVIGALLAWWLFKEPDPLRRIAGAVVVVIGVTLVAMS